jgi:hypothetical protein
MMHQRERHPYAMRDYQGYDMPERPGFYSGNRPFRMDKIRNEPLEDDELNSYAKGSQNQFRGGQSHFDQKNSYQSFRGKP